MTFRNAQSIMEVFDSGAGGNLVAHGSKFVYSEPYVKDKRLKIVLERFELPPRPISIVYPHARLLPARTRAFIDFVRADIHQFRE